MANNLLDISLLCPVKFQEKDYANPAPYNIKYDEDWAYPSTLTPLYEQAPYCQPFQNNDIIYLQLLSNYAPHNLEMMDACGNQVDTFQFAYKPTSIEVTGQKVYEVAIALDVYEEGVYFLRISSGLPLLKVLDSELFEIKAYHEGSFLIKYKHDENDFETVFETGIEFMIRTFGGFPLEQYKPGSERTTFIDQEADEVILNSRTWDIDKLIIGDAGGVPKYLIKRLNMIMGCSYTLYDGKQYVVNDGAGFEAVTEERYPKAGWGIDLRPAFNKGRKRFEADGNSNNPTTVVYNLEGEMFGPFTGPASSNIIKIESID